MSTSIMKSSPNESHSTKRFKAYNLETMNGYEANSGILIDTDDHTKKHACKLCEMTFDTVDTLELHIMEHEAHPPFICNVCGNTFTTQHKLNKHSIAHSGIKPYKCEICDKKYTQLSALNAHKDTHANLVLPCEFCHRTFRRRDSLWRHMLLHNRPKNYRCMVCAKCYVTAYRLREHMKSHTADKSFKCKVCDKGFRIKQGLEAHERTHTGEL